MNKPRLQKLIKEPDEAASLDEWAQVMELALCQLEQEEATQQYVPHEGTSAQEGFAHGYRIAQDKIRRLERDNLKLRLQLQDARECRKTRKV